VKVEAPPPSEVTESQLSSLLTRAWGLRRPHLEYLPKGVGSYHWVATVDRQAAPWFVTLDDLRTKPWLGPDSGSAFPALSAAYETAVALHDEAGLEFVVAPIRCRDGNSCIRLAEDWSVAVFPFAGGAPGSWNEVVDEGERRRILELVARLHAASHDSVRSVALPPRRPFSAQSVLEQAMCELDEPWSGGPFSEQARRRIGRDAALVRSWIDELEHRSTALDRSSGSATVVTHGEPHPGNILRDGDVRLVVDWDTVALGPPERDLWMLDDGSPEPFAAYGELTGYPIDSAAVATYRMAWQLDDLAYFVQMLRQPHSRHSATEMKFAGIDAILTGRAAQPYRFERSSA
jgi:spectinomycin phosphotransferase